MALLSIPLFHVTGCLAWLFRTLNSGSKLVTMRQWSAKEAGELIRIHGAHIIGGLVRRCPGITRSIGQGLIYVRVPTIVATLLQDGVAPPDWAPEAVIYGGAPPSRGLAQEMKERWPKASL